jgi:hypothetical protein
MPHLQLRNRVKASRTIMQESFDAATSGYDLCAAVICSESARSRVSPS